MHALVRPMVCVFVALIAAAPSAQADDADPILPLDYQEHIDVLASDLLQGREAGSKGERRAAAYIISILEEFPLIQPAGDDGDWFQEFPITGQADIESGRNVLAVLPGSDPELAHEAIILGAHYDHVGFGQHGNSLDGLPDPDGVLQIHNGADDNASGSAALLEIAAALATAERKPRRTIIFQWYSGEELGLIGSKYWADNPLHPLDDVVAMLNCDMIGRPVGSTVMVGGTGTADIWPEMLERLRQPHELDLVLDSTGIAPSDNSSFYAKQIPVLFFFTGVHEDYHRPGDDAHKIRTEPATRIVRLVHDVLREVDARDVRPTFQVANGAANYFMPTVSFGAELDRVGRGVPGGGSVAVLNPESPLGWAGLQEGDVIFRVDNEELRDFEALRELLKTTDDMRTPRQFVVWRAREGVEAPSPGREFGGTWSEWNAAYEWVEVSARPVVR
ncbi:MAG: aminopeptidase [Planctomycetota bacterium]|nr:MAG: aminopeptidase [Planctomycetota bacterium]